MTAVGSLTKILYHAGVHQYHVYFKSQAQQYHDCHVVVRQSKLKDPKQRPKTAVVVKVPALKCHMVVQYCDTKSGLNTDKDRWSELAWCGFNTSAVYFYKYAQ